MANCIMGFPNYLDNDYYDVVLTGGNWVLPLENLKNDRLSLVSKSDGLTSDDTWFEADLGILRSISLAVLPSTNCSLDAKKRLRITDIPAFSNETKVGASGSIGASSVTFKAPTSQSITVTSGNFFTIKGNLYKSATTVTIAANSTSSITLASASGNDIHNATLITSVAVDDKITCNTGNYSTTLYDSGSVDVFDIIYPFGTLSWTHPSFWTGKPTEEDRRDLIFPVIDLLTEMSIIGRYCRYDFIDTLNSDTGIAISRCFFTPGYQPSINPIYGANIQYNTDTSFDKSIGGEKSYDEKTPYRTKAFSIENLEENEALAQALEVQRVQGINKQMFFIMNPDDIVNLHRTSYTATLQSLNPLSYSYANHMSFNAILEEVQGGKL